MPERLVVIGGDATGMSAASQARRRRGPDDLEIVAFERGAYTSYSACGIPYFIGGVVNDAASLIVRTPEAFLQRQSIDARIHHEVIEIDLAKRAVKVCLTEDGTESWEGFDQLLIATGGVPTRPALGHSDAYGIFGIQTLDDGLAVRAFLQKERPTRAVVIGGGYIGLEMAEALVSSGLNVILVERRPEPMSSFDPEMGRLVTEALQGMGIDVRTNEEVVGFETTGDVVSAVVTHNPNPARRHRGVGTRHKAQQ